MTNTLNRRNADLVCLSHLRWGFVYQRPNHLMSRAAASRRVFFIEEPEQRGDSARVEATQLDGVTIVRPILPQGVSEETATSLLKQEMDTFLASHDVVRPWLWYYTPMALPWTAHVDAEAVVYDCMDELSGFKFAPPRLVELERRLLARADVVFTGGRSLYEAKRDRHPSTFLFPSSVDAAHFRQARDGLADPQDQASIAHPRIGYFGVIDERIDLDLIRDIAAARPDWQMVMVGPVVKIDENDLPRAQNIHWLGLKSYDELPAYLAGWDVAIMPFALNESTRHISPTKTPEYLSGGRPVVSTAIRDVVHPYGDERLVAIAGDSAEFVAEIERALATDQSEVIARADVFLASQSWDATWSEMARRVHEVRRAAPVVIPVRPDRLPQSAPAVMPSTAAAMPTRAPSAQPGAALASSGSGSTARLR